MTETAGIGREQAAHLASLARIAMTDAELDAHAADLSRILGSVARVSEVATAEVPATSHPIAMSNVLREDVVGETLDPAVTLAAAPDADAGKFAVPQILGEE